MEIELIKRALGGLDFVIGIFVLLFGDLITMVISRFRSLSILDTRNTISCRARGSIALKQGILSCRGVRKGVNS